MSDSLSLLLLNYEYPPLGGGAANATRCLLREYASCPELRVHLITSSTGRFRTEQPFDNVTIDFLDIGKSGSLHYQSLAHLIAYSWKARRRARRLIATRRIDLTHAFFGIPCGAIARGLGPPYIVSLRGSDVPSFNPRFALLDALLFRRLSRTVWHDAYAVVANSADLRDCARQTAPGQQIEIIPNGVDTATFVPRRSLPHRPPRILGVGRLIPRKGFDLLIDAMREVACTLTLAGDGPMREQLAARAAENGCQVTFAGALDQCALTELYQTHDIFVLPSRTEGMSNALLEAMAAGLPVITANTGGAGTLIDGNGCIVERTSEAIRAAICHITDTPERFRRMSARSHAIAKTLSWTAVAQAYRRVYRAAVS
jgi:glycosyltransferase involved in cell wall biosynthesis